MTARGLQKYDLDDRFVVDDAAELVRVAQAGTSATYRARFEGGFVRYTWLNRGTGADGSWKAEGTNTNQDINLQAKGTGVVRVVISPLDVGVLRVVCANASSCVCPAGWAVVGGGVDCGSSLFNGPNRIRASFPFGAAEWRAVCVEQIAGSFGTWTYSVQTPAQTVALCARFR